MVSIDLVSVNCPEQPHQRTQHRLASGLAPRTRQSVFFCPSWAPDLDLRVPFEAGKILLFDNPPLAGLEYFFQAPGRWYPEWIPPIFSSAVAKEVSPEHALHAVCKDDADIVAFQNNVKIFEVSWRKLMTQLFPQYRWGYFSFSYRFNHLALGNLHLDVPESEPEGHQFRWFINLDTRPRILAVGPTIFELAERFWEEKNLARFADLPVHLFVKELRQVVLDQTIYRERELPRHYLTLDPGAMWLAHSSYISHGIVYGRKTACLECRLLPETMARPERNFSTLIRTLQKHGPRP